MKSYEDMLLEMIPFSTLEQGYKYIYEHQLPLQTAAAHPVVRSILEGDAVATRILTASLANLMNKQHLTETIMFTPDVDVLVMLHPRYHPAIAHSHDFFEIQYVLYGELKQTIADQEMTLHQGDFCFIAPNIEHNIMVFSPQVFVMNMLIKQKVFTNAFHNLLSSEDLISNFFMRAIYSQNINPFLVNHTGSDPNIQSLIIRMMDFAGKRNIHRNAYTPRLLRTQFEELFLYILQDHSMDFIAGSAGKKHQQRMVDVLSYMQENYAGLSLYALAERFGYNTAYLSRALHTYTGKSFSELMLDIRFEQALRMLHVTDSSIEEIIEQIGYSDRSYFYREFRKRFGITPAEYRKRVNMEY